MDIKCYYSENNIVGILNNDKHIPLGFFILLKEENNKWGISIGSMRNSPLGTGKILLKNAIEELKKIGKAEKLWLMTAYENWQMIGCAIKCNMKIIKQDDYGYLFEYILTM